MSATKEIDGITWFQDNDGVWIMSIDADKLKKVYYDSPLNHVIKGYKYRKHDEFCVESEVEVKNGS